MQETRGPLILRRIIYLHICIGGVHVDAQKCIVARLTCSLFSPVEWVVYQIGRGDNYPSTECKSKLLSDLCPGLRIISGVARTYPLAEMELSSPAHPPTPPTPTEQQQQRRQYWQRNRISCSRYNKLAAQSSLIIYHLTHCYAIWLLRESNAAAPNRRIAGFKIHFLFRFRAEIATVDYFVKFLPNSIRKYLYILSSITGLRPIQQASNSPLFFQGDPIQRLLIYFVYKLKAILRSGHPLKQTNGFESESKDYQNATNE